MCRRLRARADSRDPCRCASLRLRLQLHLLRWSALRSGQFIDSLEERVGVRATGPATQENLSSAMGYLGGHGPGPLLQEPCACVFAQDSLQVHAQRSLVFFLPRVVFVGNRGACRGWVLQGHSNFGPFQLSRASQAATAVPVQAPKHQRRTLAVTLAAHQQQQANPRSSPKPGRHQKRKGRNWMRRSPSQSQRNRTQRRSHRMRRTGMAPTKQRRNARRPMSLYWRWSWVRTQGLLCSGGPAGVCSVCPHCL